MKALAILTSLAMTAGFAQSANALDLLAAGNLAGTGDLVEIDFAVSQDSPVVLWTDSYQNGANFDPFLSLFKLTGASWLLVAVNDDFDAPPLPLPALPGQTANPAGADSQLNYPMLQAGQYKLFLSDYSNVPLAVDLDPFGDLSLGWQIPSSQSQPLTGGTAYSVHLDNVQPAVPEPATWGLLLAGLGAVGVARRRGSAKA